MTRRHLCGVDIDCEDISSTQAGCPAQAISTIYAQSISKYLLCIVVPFPGREHNADTAPPFLCSTHPATNTTQCWKYVLLFRTADERIGDPLNGRNKFGCNKRVWELVSVVQKGNESSMTYLVKSCQNENKNFHKKAIDERRWVTGVQRNKGLAAGHGYLAIDSTPFSSRN